MHRRGDGLILGRKCSIPVRISTGSDALVEIQPVVVVGPEGSVALGALALPCFVACP